MELLRIGKRKTAHVCVANSPSQLAQGPGSRTWVTVFAVFPSYRFFPSLPPEWLHATAIPQCCSLLDHHWQTSLPDRRAHRLLHHPSGGYAGVAPQNPCERMLLPLRGIAFKYRLREDVRFEETRAALVDKDLRQTSHANASQ